MRLASSCLILAVALALSEALPTARLEDAELTTSVEDSGADKDRSKKSASFCVEIRPGSTQPGQSAQMVVEPQSYSVVPAVQPAPQQSFSVVPAVQPVPQQSFSVVPQQTYNFVPGQQPCQPPASSSLILPAQQPVQPVHTLHIMQPAPQPCPQPTYNVVQAQPAPQPAPEPVPEPAPAPRPQPERIVEVVKQEPEHKPPTQVVNIIQPAQPAPEPQQETLNILPMEPACEEQVVVMSKPQPQMVLVEEPRPKPVVLVSEPEPRPVAHVVKVPCRHQQQHAVVTECNCHPKNIVLNDSGMGHMHALALKERSMGPLYTSQQRMEHQRAMQPIMIGSGSARSPMMLLNRSIRSDEQSKKE